MTESIGRDRYTAKERQAITAAADLDKLIGAANGRRITVYRSTLATGDTYLGTTYQKQELGIGDTPEGRTFPEFKEPPAIIWVGD